MERVRAAIENDTLEQLRDEFYSRYDMTRTF